MDILAERLRNQGIVGTRPALPADSVARFGAVQSQDYLGSLWAIGLRTRAAREDEVERSVFGARIIRTWLMRGTIHAAHANDVRWILDLLAPRTIATSARRFRELGLDDAHFALATTLLTRALEGGRRLPRADVYRALEDGGIPTTGQRGYHILWRVAQDGLICFGPRQGKQPTFTLLDECAPAARRLPREVALATLARRYFSSHGPATVRDFVWWSGLTAADARAAVEAGAGELKMEAVDGDEYWLPRDANVSERPGETCFLLPPFDEYLVGYRDRGAVLAPADVKRVNAGGGMLNATIVYDGRVIGSWKRSMTPTRVRIEARPFSKLSRVQADAFGAAAEAYGEFLDLVPEVLIGSARSGS